MSRRSIFAPLTDRLSSIQFFVRQDLIDRYRTDLLGMVWLFLQPLIYIALFSAVFSTLMRARLPGVETGYGYTVYLIAGESQPPLIQSFLNTALVLATKPPHDLPKNSKILGYKTYFLGGERDSTYLSRLKSYHDSLRKKATEELANIKQYVITLEAQFEATRGKFEPLQKGKINKKQRKDWEIFHTNWAKLQKELHQNIQSWTPEMIKNEFFYGSLFVLTQQAEQGIAQLHEFQNTFFEKPSDPNTVQIQIGESTSSVRNALTLLRSKIEETEKTPLSPNGMPRRDEL